MRVFKKPACVRSKRPRVYWHHAHMCFNMCAWCWRTPVSPRDSTKMCPNHAQFTIFRVLTLLLLLGVRCVCVVSVCVVRVCAVCLCMWCVAYSLVLLSFLSHVLYIHIAAHVGFTLCSFSHEERITFHDACFSKLLTFHNGFMCFCFCELFQALFETSSPT